jgi:hypothetical protein
MHYCLQRQDLRSALSAIRRLLREIRDMPATKKLAWSDRIRVHSCQLAPPATKGGAWTETVLFNFQGHARSDGATPEGDLVIDQAGNLNGTTGYGRTSSPSAKCSPHSKNVISRRSYLPCSLDLGYNSLTYRFCPVVKTVTPFAF